MPITAVEQRVLLLTPTSKDAALTAHLLARQGIESFTCSSLAQVCEELDRGAGAVLLTEEAIQLRTNELTQWLGRQPPWSDMPLLVLARHGADSAAVAQAMEFYGNVTVIERPMRTAALLSAIRTALRARLRQYQTRGHLLERQRTEESLREADRRKNEFLAVLAHELRNPLAPIRNSLHVLRLGLTADPQSVRLGEMMQRQVNHMVRLVDDLLEISRITRGLIELRSESVDAVEILRGAVEISRPVIDAAGHRLEVELPIEPVLLNGDAVRLTQVIANLLNNAAKFTPPEGRITLTAARDRQHLEVRVVDSGIGIPAEMQARIFDIFTQVQRPGVHDQGGLGIGLSLVKSIVELHGGSVAVKSLGQGSTFTVRLPVNDVTRLKSPIIQEPPARESGRVLRIAVVDDNRDAAESLAMLLRLGRMDVQVGFNGHDAIRLMGTFQPEVILLDIGMPDMDGYETARRIRAATPDGRVRLIALTGWGQDDDRRRSEAAGFDHHLIKPVEIAALTKLLNTF